jgi:hypothetical protein
MSYKMHATPVLMLQYSDHSGANTAHKHCTLHDASLILLFESMHITVITAGVA